MLLVYLLIFVFFFQAEDGIRDLVRSRGLGDVYKRQVSYRRAAELAAKLLAGADPAEMPIEQPNVVEVGLCLLYTSDAADERSSVDLGGRRIIKKKKKRRRSCWGVNQAQPK